jgi:hypothetical protein
VTAFQALHHDFQVDLFDSRDLEVITEASRTVRWLMLSHVPS